MERNYFITIYIYIISFASFINVKLNATQNKYKKYKKFKTAQISDSIS